MRDVIRRRIGMTSNVRVRIDQAGADQWLGGSTEAAETTSDVSEPQQSVSSDECGSRPCGAHQEIFDRGLI
jgi:hypothetical protein